MDKQDYYKGERSYKTVDYGVYDDTRYLLDGVQLTCHNKRRVSKSRDSRQPLQRVQVHHLRHVAVIGTAFAQTRL